MDPSRKMRSLLPKRPQDSLSAYEAQPTGQGRRKRQQVSIACDACRRRKSKCDSRRPACSACLNSGTTCHFSVTDDRKRRDSLVLSQADIHIRSILDLLHRSSRHESDNLLSQIREAPSVNEFLETFAGAAVLLPGTPQRTIATGHVPLESPRTEATDNVGSLSPCLEPLNVPNEVIAKFPQGILPISRWTRVSTENKYLTHLFNLFFTWDNTLSHIVHRGIMTKELVSDEPGVLKFCSEFLVNAILAISHMFLCQGSPPRLSTEYHARGRDFADEAHRLLENELAHQSITLVQGLAILGTYEGNFGERTRALALLDEFHRAYDGLGLSDWQISNAPDACYMDCWQAASYTIWGLFALEAKNALTFSREMRIRPPRITKTFENPYLCRLSKPSSPEYSWSPYPGSGASQQSHFRELMSAECQLAELIWDASPFFALSEKDDRAPDFNAAMAVYNKLLEWNKGTSHRLLTNGKLVPSILALDVTFEHTMVKLLGCLSGHRSCELKPETVASTHTSYATSILSNLWVYRAAYGMRHDYWFMQSCFLAGSAIVLKLGDNPSLSKAMITACQLLSAMGEYLPVANKCLLTIKETADRYDIELPKPCMIIFAVLAVKTGTIKIRDVGMINLDLDGGSDKMVLPSFDVSFSEMIESVGSSRSGSGSSW